MIDINQIGNKEMEWYPQKVRENGQKSSKDLSQKSYFRIN